MIKPKVKDCMLLKDYLLNNKKRCNARQFARQCKVTPEHLSAIVKGKKVPSFELAKRIERVTEGQVRWHELVDDCMFAMSIRAEYMDEDETSN